MTVNNGNDLLGLGETEVKLLMSKQILKNDQPHM